ncbi:hypothetical protein FJTKL_13367 [Diaporthe vaccinii]|uniref:Amidase domain-containing protein n=1 Tax=Diaporthe vaccinii TaxID=105482 RepID=A0ABR4EAJ7_9PEZI
MTPELPTIVGQASSIDVLTSDIKTLEALLRNGQTTSRCLVEAYLAQIEKHDDYLHAMIQTTSRELLFESADSLDKGRKAGRQCGPLYGIPIIVKDTLATHPSLGLGTTAGSLSLVGSKPRKNSKVVEMLLASGAIILGKANLSEFSNSRGSMMPSGWSAVGGQTQSAYVRGGLDPDDTKDGHSSTSGSSSGSAVAVSAGYAPVSIGIETDGSLIVPAGRAALYTIKPTIGLVPQAGIVPISSHFDSAGPMTKSVYDLAILLDAISEKDSGFSFTSSLTGSWSDISVGTLDPLKWMFPVSSIEPVPMASEQICEDTTNAYEVVKGKAKSFTANVPLPSIESFKLNGTHSDVVVMSTSNTV